MDRRDFIRIVTSIYASNTLLMTLTTKAQANRIVIAGDEATLTAGENTALLSSSQTTEPETVTISNQGKNLVVDITGKPGRWVLLLYKLADKKGVEHTFIHAIDRIRKTRVVSMAVDMSESLDVDIPFMVVSSGAKKFDKNNLGTDWFNVCMSSTESTSGNLRQNHQTVVDAEHQKVVLYGIREIYRRSFAPLKRV